ncbi:MAG: hypothetical protein HOE80_03860 [Candidatus Magasanikbacteria bacterium]|nr:hypothetical protein [Candidatus Magasanikbacteria bacterium]MBT4071831.1 hypothetical protein [Candidatus Magasanikbacteria bacterium]
MGELGPTPEPTPESPLELTPDQEALLATLAEEIPTAKQEAKQKIEREARERVETIEPISSIVDESISRIERNLEITEFTGEILTELSKSFRSDIRMLEDLNIPEGKTKLRELRHNLCGGYATPLAFIDLAGFDIGNFDLESFRNDLNESIDILRKMISDYESK